VWAIVLLWLMLPPIRIEIPSLAFHPAVFSQATVTLNVPFVPLMFSPIEPFVALIIVHLTRSAPISLLLYPNEI
jgi:hypothetical protein